MTSKELIRINLDSYFAMTLQMVEDMKESATVFPTPNGGCHALWLLGHLAYSEGTIIQQFMLGGENPCADWKDIFGDGSEPESSADKYPAFDNVMASLHEVHQKNMELFESLSEEDLNSASKGCPPEYMPFFGTYRMCFNTLAGHYLMHRGQFADARRAAGLQRMGP